MHVLDEFILHELQAGMPFSNKKTIPTMPSWYRYKFAVAELKHLAAEEEWA